MPYFFSSFCCTNSSELISASDARGLPFKIYTWSQVFSNRIFQLHKTKGWGPVGLANVTCLTATLQMKSSTQHLHCTGLYVLHLVSFAFGWECVRSDSAIGLSCEHWRAERERERERANASGCFLCMDPPPLPQRRGQGYVQGHPPCLFFCLTALWKGQPIKAWINHSSIMCVCVCVRE